LGRKALAHYLGLANYCRNLLRMGFRAEDLADGGSDRLVDGLIAWGDPSRVHARIADHLAAGADHVCLQVLTAASHDVRDPAGLATLPRAEWRELAPSAVA
jgi:hypothetical protein